MKRKFSRRYQAALLAYLKQGAGGHLQSARGMGQQALAAGTADAGHGQAP